MATESTTAMVKEANRPVAGSTPAMIENEIAPGTRASATTRPARTSVRQTFGSDSPGADEREALLERVREYQQAASEQVEKLRVQLSRAEGFSATLGARLEREAPAARS
ncbi:MULTISPECIES: hypothetical protein [Streptomyces]|uniref:hypothetical protein n=1 Tax=Streptomyces TaxID=1883 RepID=UPI001CC250A9|nr:hypothetical protein [Streptomyces venezuelae]